MPQTIYDRMVLDLPEDTYRRSNIMRAIMAAEATEIESLRASVSGQDGAINQIFAITASWTLSKWEQMLGLPSGTSLPVEERRSRINARWQSFGTITPDRIKAIVDSFQYGQIDIIEDFENYTIRIVFTDVHGVPPYEDAVVDAVQAALPAHLVVTVDHTYVLWRDNDGHAMTWAEFGARALPWSAVSVSE